MLTELLKEQSINICCLTETWLKQDNGPLLAEIKREGFEIISVPRKNKRGGGIALLSETNKYNIKKLKTTNYKTFELLEVIVHGKTENIRIAERPWLKKFCAAYN